MNNSAILCKLLTSGETLIMPDAYDPISARIIERAGFKAVQCSGGSIAIAACHPSEADLCLADNVEATRRIANTVNVPVMADGENGYGDPDEVDNTVRQFIRAGAAGVNIEDLIPKRGNEYRIIDSALMVEKLIAAREAAVSEGDSDFIINARTDALRAFDDRKDGLKEAIVRANHYLDVGADLAFICYTATLDEVKSLTREIHGPISIAAGMPYNIREFTIDDLRQHGVTRVSLPMLAILSTVQSLSKSISLISEPKGFSRIADDGLYCSAADLFALSKRRVEQQ
jgi:2-methylisocitrate lyase-like PEP mutase family enzyme